jgi:hypothetical protein
MAKFELVGPDGKKYEVEAPDAKSAVAALSKITTPIAKNPDGTYGQAPEGFMLNPNTGQMEDLRSPNNPNVFTGRAAAVGLGAGQGLSYDMMDEAVGGARGAVYGDGQYSTALMRESDRRAKEDYPLSYNVPKIGGAILSSLGLGSALGITAAPTVAGRAMQGVGLGAAEGAMFGAGQGESLQGRAMGALGYGAAGGVLGGAAPFAIEGARRGIDAMIGAPIASMRSAPSAVRASRAVETAVGRSGKTATELESALRLAVREGQPEFAVADALGNPGQRMLSGIARTPNDARNEIVDFLTKRQDTQGERLAGILDTAMNSPNNLGKTAREVKTGLESARSTAANTAYSAARGNAAPVDVRGALAAIDNRIGGMQGSGVVGDGIDAKLTRYRSRLAASPASLPDGTTARELSDFDRVLGVKQEIADDIGAAVRAGRKNEARELGKIKDALDGALEASSAPYRAANDEFAQASRVIDAVDQGAAAARPTARSADVLNQYGGMTTAQQEAFRAGRVDPAIARIDSAAVGVNKARPLTSGKAQAEFGAMASNPALLERQIGRENTMFQTGNAALGGSKTADNLADATEMQNFDYGVLANLFRGNLSSAMQQAIPTALNVLQGRNTATRAEIARALLSTDIKAALKPAELARVASAPKSALAEILVRSLLRLSN